MKVSELKKLLEGKDDDLIVFHWADEYMEWWDLSLNEIKIGEDDS
jgi:hypothetical protein